MKGDETENDRIQREGVCMGGGGRDKETRGEKDNKKSELRQRGKSARTRENGKK
jgi:hypothetical protein